jgi:SAM-dependent methyltransferase
MRAYLTLVRMLTHLRATGAIESQPIVPDSKLLRLEAWDRIPPDPREPLQINRHGVTEREMAWKALTGSGVVAVSATRLPFPDRSFDHVVLADLLEYVRDERVALGEAHRVISPGGRLTVIVPFLGPTSWLDGTNWHRYLHDLRGSESQLPELAESGWRRRYRKQDLENLVTLSGFSLASLDQRGTGLSEFGWFVGRLLEEKRRQSPAGTGSDIIRMRYRARALDRRAHLGPLGSWLILEATKP